MDVRLPDRVCRRGHLVSQGTTGGVVIHGKYRLLDCLVCRRLRSNRPRTLPDTRRWAHENPANPWAGRQVCPECGSAEWTLPYYPGSAMWRCVWPCHLFFTPERSA